VKGSDETPHGAVGPVRLTLTLTLTLSLTLTVRCGPVRCDVSSDRLFKCKTMKISDRISELTFALLEDNILSSCLNIISYSRKLYQIVFIIIDAK